MSARDPMVIVWDTLSREGDRVGTSRKAEKVIEALRAAGLLRDEAREKQMREALESARDYIESDEEEQGWKCMTGNTIRAALEDER